MRILSVAGRHAKGLAAEIILLRVIPDPAKVGVIAQLISTDRPHEKASEHIGIMIEQLKGMGVSASGEVRVGAVAETIMSYARQEKVDLLFIGASDPKDKNFFLMKTDPVVSYLVDNSEISLYIVKGVPLDSYSDPEDLDETENQSGASESSNRKS